MAPAQPQPDGAAALGALRASRRSGHNLEQALRATRQTVRRLANPGFYVTAMIARWRAPRLSPPGLEVLAGEGRERRRQHDGEVRDRPEREVGAAGLRAAEGPELDRQTGEAAALRGDPVERVLVEVLEGKRPRRSVGDRLERVRVERQRRTV